MGCEHHKSRVREKTVLMKLKARSNTKKAGKMLQNPQVSMSPLYVAVTGAGLLLQSLHLFAGSSTANVNVSANVTSNCKFSGINSLYFGDYDHLIASPTDATGQANLSCTKGTSVTLSINNGLHASGPQRRLIDGSGQLLNYQIYTTPARNVIWDTSNTVSFVAATSAVTAIPLYGRMPAGQGGGTGGYTDTVTITATF